MTSHSSASGGRASPPDAVHPPRRSAPSAVAVIQCRIAIIRRYKGAGKPRNRSAVTRTRLHITDCITLRRRSRPPASARVHAGSPRLVDVEPTDAVSILPRKVVRDPDPESRSAAVRRTAVLDLPFNLRIDKNLYAKLGHRAAAGQIPLGAGTPAASRHDRAAGDAHLERRGGCLLGRSDNHGEAPVFTGSPDIWWGSRLQSSGDEEHSESVVGEVAVAAGQAAVEFDDAVDGLGAAVVGSAGGEVGQERVLPAA